MYYQKQSYSINTQYFKYFLFIFLINLLFVFVLFQYNVAAEKIVMNSAYENHDNNSCENYKENHLICENEYKQTDIVFDSTGSMYEEVSAMKEVIVDFADELKSSGIDYRLGLTEYRAFQLETCGDKTSFPYKIYNNGDLTSFANSLKSWIENISVKGGGYESVLAALKHTITDQKWRSNSKKIIILVGDEVPEPDGHECNHENNTLNGVISELKKNSIITYVIGTDQKCINQNNNTCTEWESNDSMITIARETGGQFYNITNTSTIIPLIHQIKDALKCTFDIVPYASCENEYDHTDKTHMHIEAQLVGKDRKFIPFIEKQMTVSAVIYNSEGNKITEVELNPESSSSYGEYFSADIDVEKLNNNAEVRYIARICEWSETKVYKTDCISANVDWEWVYPFPQGNQVNAVWGTGLDNIYAVGDVGTVIHHDGISWRKINNFTLNDLNDVFCFSNNSIIVVGDSGVIFHYDGKFWKKIPSPTNNDLYQVWGESYNNYYISEDSTLYHFNGLKWNKEEIPIAKILYVFGKSINTVYVGLSTGEVFVKSDDIWKQIFELDSYHNDLWAYSKDYIFAAGDKGIRHYDGKEWHDFIEMKNVKRIAGIDQSNVYAITYQDIWFFDGESWAKVPNVIADNSSFDIAGKIWTCKPSHLYFTSFNDLLHFNGTNIDVIGAGPFQPYISGNRFSFNSIWVSSKKNILIAGLSNNAGSVFQFDGKSWSKKQAGCQDSIQYSSGTNLSILGNSEDNIYMLGSCNQIFHYDGLSWGSIHTVDNMDLYDLFNDMWISQEKTLYINSYKGNILTYNTSNISNISQPMMTSCCYNSLWGASDKDLYVTSEDNIFHYNGQTWNIELTASPSDSNFKSIHGLSTEFVVAISDNTTKGSSIHSFNGTDWSQQDYNEKLNCVWALNNEKDKKCFIVGNNGTIMQSASGNEWSNLLSGTNRDLKDIHGSSIYNIHAIASESVLKYCPAKFTIDDAISASGSTFVVSARLKNSLKVPIKGINLVILFDNEMLQPVDVSLKGSVLDGKNYNQYKNISENKLNVGISAMGTINFYAGNGIIANISFKVIGNNHYSDIMIEKAFLNDNDEVCSDFGRFYLKDPVAGKVIQYATKAPVNNVDVRITGNNQSFQTVTNENGCYTFNGLESGTYELIPSKTDVSVDIGAPDATMILRGSVDDNFLNCHQRIAADATQDNKVLAHDASIVANYAAGLTSCLNDQCINWAFIPEEITECDHWEWPYIFYPKTRQISLPPNSTHNNFIAFPLGYVFHPSASNRRSTKQLNDKTHIIFVNQKQRLTIPIHLGESTEIWGADITIAYDSSILTHKESTLSGGILEKYDMLENIKKDGEIRLVIYTDDDLITNSGDLAYISFEITSTTSLGVINLTQFDVNKMNLYGGFKYDETISTQLILSNDKFDFDNNSIINLNDVIVALKVLSGMEISIIIEHDIIEMKDVIFVLQYISSIK